MKKATNRNFKNSLALWLKISLVITAGILLLELGALVWLRIPLDSESKVEIATGTPQMEPTDATLNESTPTSAIVQTPTLEFDPLKISEDNVTDVDLLATIPYERILHISPDLSRAVGLKYNNQNLEAIVIWDMLTETELTHFPVISSSVQGLWTPVPVVSDNHQWIAVHASDNQITILDAMTLNVVAVLEVPETPLSQSRTGLFVRLAFSHDSKLLAAGMNSESKIYLWDSSSWNLVGDIPLDQFYAIDTIQFNEDDHYIMAKEYKADRLHLQIFQLDDLKEIFSFQTDCWRFASDSVIMKNQIINKCSEHLEFIDFITKEIICSNNFSRGARILGISEKKNIFVISDYSDDGGSFSALIDMKTCEIPKSVIEKRIPTSWPIVFSDTGNIFFTSTGYRPIKIYDTITGEELHALEFESAYAMRGMMLTNSGRWLLAPYHDGKTRVWGIQPEQ